MAPSTKGLTFAGAKSDVEKLKARNVDLAALLPPLDDPTATASNQDPLQQSYAFVRAARDALAVANSGQVDNAVSSPCHYFW